ncbi:ESPR-type extended signal peptide-containing protein [Acinetobacter baumannii]|nr:ESPR-type extended signal peptide-containing protein [Acinetobacter baumannii]MDC5550982.1 ESPR-type extended signal peptide-containing protein [Acinetobacter baumannii]
MNKIYKVVWNASIGTWIVVSELAKSKTRTGSVSSSSEITGSQNEIVSKEKKFRPKALVLSIISCLAVSHVWADYTNLYGSIIDTSPTISNGIAIGANTGTPATANDSNGLAVGSRANASAADSTALGNYVNATGVNSTVVGGQASAAGAQSIALQNNSDADLVAEGLATGSSFTAVDSASSYSVAIGAMSQVVGSTAAMAIGKNAQVNSGANNATAIGNTATVDTNAVDGVAIGTNSLTSAANSVALGPRSTANVTNSVALGAGSTTTVQSGNSYITNVAASTTNGVVSVGSATNTRRIQNVADGAADSDAVTVAQLKDVNNRAVGNTTALGGGAAYNPATDVYTPPSYTITKTDGTTYTPVNTVSGALTNLNNEVVKPITFAGNTGSSANNLGTTLNITGGGSTAGTYSGNNLKTAVTGNTVNIQMADAPVFSGTVTAGNLTTGGSLNVTGASNLNGGANLNNQKITNLAAGTISSTSTDAVNGSQLNTTNQNVTTAQNTANTAVTNAAAAQNTANTAVTNAAAAQATADKGLNFSVNGGTADNVKLGETVNFANGTNTTAVYDPATNTYKYNVNDNIALTNAGSLTVGNSKVDNSGLTITGGPSVTTAGINAGNQKITNVAAGTISSTSTDAVNGSQLNTTNQNVTTAQNTANTAVTNAAAAQATADKGLNFSVNGGTADNVKLGEMVNFADGTNTTAVYDPATNTYKYNVNDNIALTNAGSLTVGNTKVDNSGLTITGGPSVTTAGINAGNQKITNVTAGTISATSTDAVNGSQLNTTNQNVATAQNTANTAVTNAAAAQNTANTAVTNAAAAQATADKGLNFSVNGGTADNVKLGETVNFADGTNTTAVYDPATNTYKYNVNDNIALTNAGSLTVGNTKVDNSGLTITGGPSVTTAGINAGNQKITNVTAGTISATSTDAVNGSQLNTTNQNVTTAQNTANTAVTNAAAAQNTANTAVTNAAAAQATADKGLNFSVNGGTADNVKLGETVNFADGTNTTAVYDSATNTYKYNVNDNIALTNAGSLTVGNTKVDNSGLTITGGPSVTTAGINAGNQKITNVAAGTNATDAVNVSQLDALSTSSNNKTDALGNSTANNLGGGASYDSTTGAVSSPTYTVNGNNVNNVGDAITALDKGWTLQSNGTNAAAVKAGDTVDIGTVAGETNLKVTKTGNTIQYGLNRDLNIDSVTAGDSKLDTNGLTIAGGPSVTKTGIDAAGNTISNVAAGTNATDAVNKGQLDALSTSSNNKTDALGNSTANNLGGGSSYDSTTGAVSSPTYVTTKTDGTTVNANNVGDALTNLNNEVVKPITFAGNSGSVDRKLGETLNITGGLTASGSNSNVKTVISGNTVDIQLADAPVFAGKLTANGLDANGEKVTNVGAGTAATDAVNKGQLDALSTSSNNKTDALGNSTANNLGGGASYDSTTGAVSSPTYTVNGNNVNNVGDAITALDKGWTLQSNGANAAAVKAGDTVDIGTVAGESNLKVTKTGNTIQYGLNRDLNIDSVTAGDSKLDTNGLTIAGGPSVTKTGIDAAGNTISNVAAGTNATDAVNKGQLDALSTSSNNKTDALGNSTANNLGGGASYDSTTGAVSSPTYTVNGNNVNNVGDAITALDKGWTLQSNGTNAAAVKAGDTVDIGTVAGESNLKVTKTGNTIQYGLNRDLNIDSVTAGDSKLDTNGLTITGGPSVTKSGIDAAGNTISNVAAGTNATDAVNKGQLDALSTSSNNKTDALGNSTANNLGGGSSYDSTTGTVSSPTYVTTKTDGTTINANNVGDALTNLNNEVVKPITFAGNSGSVDRKLGETLNITGGLTASGSNSNVKTVISGNTVDIQLADAPVFAGKLTANGLDANGEKVTNVGAGTNATDAVNKGQLDALSTSSNNKTDALGNSTANNLGGGSSYDSTTGVVSSPTYTVNGNNVNNVGDAITALDKGWTLQSNGANAAAVKAGDTVDIGTVAGESNLKVSKTGNTIQYGLNRDLNIDSVTAGDSKLDSNGLSIAGGPSVTKSGIDAAGNTITNVAAGTNATDAVNKGQLDALSTSSNNKTDALGNSTANNLGGGSSYDSTTGVVSSPTYTVNGNNVNNVGDAITALDKGWTLQSNGANAAAVKAGDTVDIGTVAGESNLKVSKTGNTIQYGLNRDLNIDSVTAGDSKLDSNGLSIAGGPSVTKSGIDAAGNTISNVAAGTNATDAVNKGQLDHVDNRVTQVTNTTASIFGGGAKANPDGSISNPSYNVAGTSANNVGDALTALDKAVTDAGTAANAGWTVSANGDAATAKNIKPNGKVNFTGDDNLTVAQTSETDNEGNIKVALNKNLKVDSVTTGTTVIDTTGVKVGDNVQLGSTGLIIAGGPTITTSGISAGNKTISNVAAGVSSTDAVNKGQLDSAISSINNNVGALANSAVQYDKNSDGSVNKDSITLAGGANGTTIKNVANGTVAEGSKDAVNGGQLWTVQQQVNKNTGDISNLQTDISNINNGKSGLVQQADKDAAITVGKDTGGTQVNVAGTAGERTVTGVKAGAVTESSKDAVNGSQLNTTNQALVNYLGGGAGYDNITQSFSNPTYNVGDQSYHNVGDAIGALNQADQTLNTKIDNVSNKLEQAFYATNQRIDDVEKRANAGIAAAMALENAPFVAGKYTYAVGAAYHGGENAVGVTLRKTADNGRWSLTGGVAAASQGDPSVRIGISGVID